MGLQPYRLCVSAICLALLAGCALPRGAAVEKEILRDGEGDARNLMVVAVARDNIGKVAHWPGTGQIRSYGWLQRSPGSGSQMIAPGDAIDLSIWDDDENSLLTSPQEKTVQIKGITVSPKGTVFVPYINEVSVAGQTPEQARSKIQAELDTILTSPQVLLSITQGRKNSVDLVGGVATPGSYPMDTPDLGVLGLISLGGGISPALKNPQIRLVRGGSIYGISQEKLFSNPRLDTTLRGGDKVFVEEDARYFIALGSSGQQDLIYFSKDTVSVLDAVSMIGGVKETRANPKSVLILREYPASALRSNGTGPDRTRVVFTLDLTSADGLFSARSFQIQPQDLVLVTESEVNSLRSVLSLIGQGFGAANAAQSASD